MDDSIVRSSVSSMLQASNISIYGGEYMSRANSVLNRAGGNINQIMVDGYDLEHDDFFLYEGQNDSRDNAYEKIFLSHREANKDIPYSNLGVGSQSISFKRTCHYNQPSSKAGKPISSKSDDDTYKVRTPNNILNPLRRCKSQSILKSSSAYCSTPQLKRTTSFSSTLQIHEYGDNILADNSRGDLPMSYGQDYIPRKTQVIALDEYEHNRSPRLSGVELRAAAQFRMLRLRHKQQRMHMNKETMNKTVKIKHLKSIIRKLLCSSKR